MDSLLSDAENIADNFRSYLNHFSTNVIDILEKFDFDKEITKLDNNGILYNVIQEFCSKKAYMGLDAISAVDMGYIFEELVRKFSESYDEQAGAHFTARDIIYLMAELLVAPRKTNMKNEGITATMYDMAMGTSQMLDCLSEKLHEIDPDANLTEFGQELNEQTFAIAKANMLIKGGDADNMKHGNTLSNDMFEGFTFDYIISNPPFGIEWKNEKAKVEEEHKKGEYGRFGAGLLAIGDSQQLFVLNGVAKLKDNGRMAIIQNGSPLFKGDAGSGESNIRGYLLENDWLEAIVQIPNDMFYNTGIATYIWIVTKDKSADRVGKVQLIDASKCSVKRRKPLGNKRNEFDENCIALITKAYKAFANDTYADGDLVVESKVKENEDFKFRKVQVEFPSEKASEDKKAKPEKDTEIIPWKEDVKAYMEKNVLPFQPKAKINEKQTKIGYEIPFTREFYKYIPLEPSENIFAKLKDLEAKETELMNKILGS
ncbi:MAG: SAM-dependent methyltransferase [Bacteroidales bacterium]|nr:SAM-dependent methyltransferase [Bacteroidales bacterium]